jgi:hypothetical protein
VGKSILDISRDYFLSFDQVEKEKIISSLSDEEKDSVIEIGAAFTSHDGIVGLAKHPFLSKYFDELKDLQIEYFIFLSELISEGKTNSVIEKLKQTENELFIEVLKEFSDIQSFERDFVKGVNKIEREEQKYMFTLLEKSEEELNIPDEEIQHAITLNERKYLKEKLIEIDNYILAKASSESVFRPYFAANTETVGSRSLSYKRRNKIWTYAIAASIIIATSGIGYFYLNRNESNNVDSFSKRDIINKRNVYVKKGIISKSSRLEIQVLSDNLLSQSEESSVNYITVDINYLKIDHADSVSGINKSLNSRNIEEINDTFSKKNESNNLIDTYTYFNYYLVLNLDVHENIDNISLVSLDGESKSDLYLVLNSEYYRLTKTMIPIKLVKFTSKKKIDLIRKIVDQANRFTK